MTRSSARYNGLTRSGGARLVALALGFALFVTACSSSSATPEPPPSGGGGPGPSPTNPEPQDGGFLRFGGAESNIDSLNPFVASNIFGMSAINYIYPKLVQYDSDMKLVGDLATGWTMSEDGASITFALVEGSEWSDGEPMTSADVAWTLNTILTYADGPAAVLASGIAGLESVETPDDVTVVLTYAGPSASALANLQIVPILPVHVWEPLVGDEGSGLQSFDNAPPMVAGGPFTVTEFTHNEIARFERNDAYYGPRPNIEGFGLRRFSNADAMVRALKNGEIDAALELPAVHLGAFEGDDAHEVASGPSFIWYTIGFNSNPDKPRNTELLDPDVRRAIAMAVDLDEFIRVIEDGRGQPIATQAPQAFRTAHLDPLPHDVDAANKLLDDLGYERGSDGVRVANGHRMSYELLASDGLGEAARRAQLIAEYVAEIGIELRPRILDGAAFWSTVTGPDGEFTESDIFLESWGNVPDPDLILSVMTCAQRGGLNETGYCNPAYDELHQQQASATDPATRQSILDELQEILYRDRPFSPMYQKVQSEVWGNDWQGYWLTPLGSFSFLSKMPLESVHQTS